VSVETKQLYSTTELGIEGVQACTR